jgi:hypothetical protein
LGDTDDTDRPVAGVAGAQDGGAAVGFAFGDGGEPLGIGHPRPAGVGVFKRGEDALGGDGDGEAQEHDEGDGD